MKLHPGVGGYQSASLPPRAQQFLDETEEDAGPLLAAARGRKLGWTAPLVLLRPEILVHEQLLRQVRNRPYPHLVTAHPANDHLQLEHVRHPAQDLQRINIVNQKLGHFDLATIIAVVVIPYVARRGDDPQVETALAATEVISPKSNRAPGL
jgi:hypothetical protein